MTLAELQTALEQERQKNILLTNEKNQLVKRIDYLEGKLERLRIILSFYTSMSY